MLALTKLGERTLRAFRDLPKGKRRVIERLLDYGEENLVLLTFSMFIFAFGTILVPAMLGASSLNYIIVQLFQYLSFSFFSIGLLSFSLFLFCQLYTENFKQLDLTANGYAKQLGVTYEDGRK